MVEEVGESLSRKLLRCGLLKIKYAHNRCLQKTIIEKKIMIFLFLVSLLMNYSFLSCQYRYSVYNSDMKQNLIFLLQRDTASSSNGISIHETCRPLVILGEVSLGAVTGCAGGLLGGIIAIQVSNPDGLGAIGVSTLGITSGFFFGYPYGIYLEQKGTKVSYWELLASEIIGAGIGTAIDLISHYNRTARILPFALPLAFPIAYIEIVK